MSDWPSSNTTARGRQACSPTGLEGGSGRPVTAAPATSRRKCRASWVCLDCFYIGKLKGVGTLWQVTACDAACSFAFAAVIPAVGAVHCARFLQRVLLPAYRKAGWKLQRVLTDNGSEFKGLFDAVCSQLGIRHTRTKPRHSWTNGFVERLQGTILHEHWRVAFRRRFFTSAAAVDRSLQSFVHFYNHQRPHHGYRLNGRTPADIFLGAVQS